MGLAELSNDTFSERLFKVGCDDSIENIATMAKEKLGTGNEQGALATIMAFAPKQIPLPPGASQADKETSMAVQQVGHQSYYDDLKRLGGFDQSFMNKVADALGMRREEIKKTYVANVTKVEAMHPTEYHVGG